MWSVAEVGIVFCIEQQVFVFASNLSDVCDSFRLYVADKERERVYRVASVCVCWSLSGYVWLSIRLCVADRAKQHVIWKSRKQQLFATLFDFAQV